MAVNTSKINCTLYLEGVQVPFTSIQIVEKDDAPPICSIGFPVTTKALKVLPGTIVHVFGEVPIRGIYSDNNNNSLGKIETKDILLFEGEVSGLGYSKTDMSRSVTISAESFMYHWAKVYKRSIDILTNQSYLSALYVMTADAYELEIPKDMKESLTEVEKKAFQNEAVKYQQFEYETNTNNPLGGFSNFFEEAWSICGPEKQKEGEELNARNRGDWYPLFEYLLKSVEALNHYYSVFSKIFKLTDTTFSFPNARIVSALQYMVDENFLRGQDQSMGNNVTLLMLFMQILEFINYKMLFPSSPTLTNHLSVEGKKIPVRTYFLPDLKWGPPLLSNIVFPSETLNVSFSRHMSSEPTRIMTGSPPLKIRHDADSYSELKAWYLAPGLPFLKLTANDQQAKDLYTNLNPGLKESDSQDPYILSFSPEETYRGVKAETTRLDGIENAFLVDLWNEQGVTKNPQSEEEKTAVAKTLAVGSNNEGTLALNAAMLSLFNKRYSTRSCNITAAWNPFRMVGLPALIFDTDTSPSIAGTLSSHTTVIDANGNASSSMTLSYARLIWDAENKDSLQELIPLKSTVTSRDADTHRYSSWEADPIPFLPEWLDPYWYDTAHIGRDVYSIITTGKRPKKTNTPGDSNWGVEDNAGGPEHSMKPYLEVFTKNGTDTSLTIDSSIFNFLRDPYTGKFTANNDGRDAIYNVDPEVDPVNIVTAARMAHALRVLKRQYGKAAERGREQEFIINTTSRNLIGKEDYWTFLLDGDTLPSIEKHYKDTHNDGSVSNMSPDKINQLIVDYMSNGSPSMFDYLNTVDDEFKDLLKPFTKKRRDHVVSINAGTKNK